MEESSIPTYSLEQVQAGFKSHPDLLVRIETINSPETIATTKGVNENPALNSPKHKIILSRAESEKRLADGIIVIEGANLHRNEYGSKLFADFFFFITGFHGFHVFSGVIINIIIFINVLIGTYEKRRTYEMVEKVGLYWHFVDLVWVFVFTFFYLV
jgi:cytochrome c oxidase subunit 3